jgi:hypothetical protein
MTLMTKRVVGTIPKTPVIPTQVVLESQKTYDPSQWQDGLFDELDNIGEDVAFEIAMPSEIPVIAGNAGNNALAVIVDESGANEICSCKGGADVSKPIESGNPVQIEKGLKYHFQSCSDGTTASELVAVDAPIRVSVNNGDRTETNRVRATFSVSQ